MTRTAKAGAIAFGAWGVLHIVGGGAILASTIVGGPGEGYAFYGHDGTPLPGATGAILGYFCYLLILVGLAAIAIAARMNWYNSETGLALNTGLILAVEIGLILFLMLPGHLAFSDGLPGFLLFATGAVLGGIACRRDAAHA